MYSVCNQYVIIHVSALIAALSCLCGAVSLGLPLFSAVVSAACLVVLGYGLALAPKPQTASDGDAKP